MSPLNTLTLPLEGRHLIEASAGTGKTYNITQIYLRLILEKKLTVNSILVVTFTKAATEELKGRISSTIRDCLKNWGAYTEDFPLLCKLQSTLPHEEAIHLLQEALFNLDEAAILTIHGFCKQILTQHAFDTDIAFDATMEADATEFKLQGVQDWYRRLVNEAYYDEFISYWPTPEKFYEAFAPLLGQQQRFESTDSGALIAQYTEDKQNARASAIASIDTINQVIEDKCGDEGLNEFARILDWLALTTLEEPPVVEGLFFKHMKNIVKPLLTPIKHLCDRTSKGRYASIKKAMAYDLAAKAIEYCRKQLDKQKRQQNQLDFDDLIFNLHTAVTQGANRVTLISKLQNQYPAALVDEFQDTDQYQYQIFDAIYANSTNTAFYMIGDPKQAIYGFRGGDVFAYLAARNDADFQWSMDTNWRSSGSLINAYNALFETQQSQTGDTTFRFGIDYVPVKASPGAEKKLLIDGDNQSSLQFIHFPVNPDYQQKLKKPQEEIPNNKSFQQVIAHWCAEEITRLLVNGIQTDQRTLEEKDIAILVRNKNEAGILKDALEANGLPSVYLSARENIFHTPEAIQLLRVLEGILLCEYPKKMISALATPYFCYSNQALIELQENDDEWESLQDDFKTLRDNWMRHGIMASLVPLLETGFKYIGKDRERQLTNTLHLLDVLQIESEKHPQPDTLCQWLRQEIDSPSYSTNNELRLESDSNLIKIVTQHSAKGLEYPVVFIPFSTYSGKTKSTLPYLTYHDRQSLQAKTLLGDDKIAFGLWLEEQEAEDIRLLYVAVTRAIYRCYLPVTAFANVDKSPLGLLLKLPNSLPNTLKHHIELLACSTEQIALCDQSDLSSLSIPFQHADDNNETAKVATLSRHITATWRVHSFSSLSNQVNAPFTTIARDPEVYEGSENKILLNAPITPQLINGDIRFSFARGSVPGNFLHTLLEYVEFSTADWTDAEIVFDNYSDLVKDRKEEIKTWLESCLHCPLPCQISLADLDEQQLLKECEFYFQISEANMTDLNALLISYRKQTFENHFQAQPVTQIQKALQGMMCGFIDLIFENNGKYYVVDYKSTYLGDHFASYSREAMQQNILDSNYDLQYLIYTIALHRYLKQRLADYNPEEHLGGVYYLYLRGMHKDENDELTGVYYQHIPIEIIENIDLYFSHTKDAPQEISHRE